MKIGINGFGRIGRNAFRAALCRDGYGKDLEIVAVNDIAPVDSLAYMLRWDSVYGRLDARILRAVPGECLEGARGGIAFHGGGHLSGDHHGNGAHAPRGDRGSVNAFAAGGRKHFLAEFSGALVSVLAALGQRFHDNAVNGIGNVRRDEGGRTRGLGHVLVGHGHG